MYLEGDKWKNWHTRCSDAAIKEIKSEEDTKLSTISVSKLLEYAHTALHHCEINNLDPYKVPVFLTLERDNNLYSNIGLGICCSSQLGTYVRPNCSMMQFEPWHIGGLTSVTSM